MVSEVTYDPPVVFTGYICGDYKNLSGNGAWKNECRFVEDTLRMYFYSDNFQEINNIRDGDLIRLDIYPGDNPLIGTARVLFHMARYHGKNSSYTVRPMDTLFNRAIAKMQRQISGTKSSDKILIDDIYIRSPPESGTNGEILEIKDGKIEGVIE